MKNYERHYYIAGRECIPARDILLCDVRREITIPTFGADRYFSLYATKQRFFYTIEAADGLTKVDAVSEEKAREILEMYPAYINNKNYDSVFGRPERG